MNGRIRPLDSGILLLLWGTVTTVAVLFWPVFPIIETRYASVAWDMWLTDQWLVPHLNGNSYSHKPPFMFWLWNVGWATWGVSTGWLRLANALLTLGTLLLARTVAKELWPHNPDVARLTPIILMGTLLWCAATPAIMFDIPLAFWTVLAVLGIVMAVRGVTYAWLITTIAMALGILTKGPIVFLHVLPIPMLAPVWATGQSWSRWYGCAFGSVLLALGLALLWAVPAAQQGGEKFAEAIFLTQTAGRIVASFAHAQPVWWYLPMLPLLMLPWLAWGATWRGLRKLSLRTDPGVRFCLTWGLGTTICLSLVSGKQIHYLIPLLPAIALLLARALSLVSRSGVMWPVAAMLLGLAGAFAYATTMIPPTDPRLGWLSMLPAWPAVVCTAMAGSLLMAKTRPSVIARTRHLAAISVALMVIFTLGIVGPARHRYDVSAAAAHVRELMMSKTPVAYVGDYNGEFQFLGRLPRPLTVLNPHNVLDWAQANPNGVIAWRFRYKPPIKAEPIRIFPWRSKKVGFWSTGDLPTVNQQHTSVAE